MASSDNKVGTGGTSDFLQLARLALTSDHENITRFLQRVARLSTKSEPGFADELREVLRRVPTSRKVVREAAPPLPLDGDSRLELVRVEVEPQIPHVPVWSELVSCELRTVIEEREKHAMLSGMGLKATRTLLFTGPPGVGKTLTARWIATRLRLPLLTLDLSSVISSYLGRTGNNLRRVFDYAKRTECVLLLDEFDAIAKERGDSTELGELKRLVTVILQELDSWPDTGLLIAATNHSSLLDSAVWRRFDSRVHFSYPEHQALVAAVDTFLAEDETVAPPIRAVLAELHSQQSFSEVERVVVGLRKRAAISGQPLKDIVEEFVRGKIQCLDKKARIRHAIGATETGALSQRAAAELFSVNRSTIRNGIGGEK